MKDCNCAVNEPKILSIQTTVQITYQQISNMLVTCFESGSLWVKYCKACFKGEEELAFAHDRQQQRQAYFQTLADKYQIDYTVGYSVLPLSDDPADKIIVYTEEFDDSGKTAHDLNLDRIKIGLQLLADKYPHYMVDVLSQNNDANCDDMFLQLCLFGEEVFC